MQPAEEAAESISDRIAQVLDARGASDEEAARVLATVGYETSYETVRRYRKGLAKRIDAGFCAALCLAFPVSAEWLLLGLGERVPENASDAGDLAISRQLQRHTPALYRRLIVYSAVRADAAALRETGGLSMKQTTRYVDLVSQDEPTLSDLDEMRPFAELLDGELELKDRRPGPPPINDAEKR